MLEHVNILKHFVVTKALLLFVALSLISHLIDKIDSFDFFQGLAFRRNSHQLFSASQDRSVKLWNIDEMTYVETL